MDGRSKPVVALATMLDDAIDAIGADMGNIQLLDAAGHLWIAVSRGFGSEFLEFFAVVHSGGAACGTALQEMRRVAVREVARSPIFENTASLEIMQRARALA